MRIIWGFATIVIFLMGCACGKNQDRNQNGSDNNLNPVKQEEVCIDSSKINKDMMCIQLWDPVCGCDGKTYSNTCYAQREGVTRWNEGECPE